MAAYLVQVFLARRRDRWGLAQTSHTLERADHSPKPLDLDGAGAISKWMPGIVDRNGPLGNGLSAHASPY
jgi:hypothetical protein